MLLVWKIHEEEHPMEVLLLFGAKRGGGKLGGGEIVFQQFLLILKHREWNGQDFYNLLGILAEGQPSAVPLRFGRGWCFNFIHGACKLLGTRPMTCKMNNEVTDY